MNTERRLGYRDCPLSDGNIKMSRGSATSASSRTIDDLISAFGNILVDGRTKSLTNKDSLGPYLAC